MLNEILNQDMMFLDPIGLHRPQVLSCALKILRAKENGIIVKVLIYPQKDKSNTRQMDDLFDSFAFRGYVNDSLESIMAAAFPRDKTSYERKRTYDYLFRSSSYGCELKDDGSIIFSYNITTSDCDIITKASFHDLMNLRKQASLFAIKNNEILSHLQ